MKQNSGRVREMLRFVFVLRVSLVSLDSLDSLPLNCRYACGVCS